jgi:hypothetical protein
MSDNDDLRHLRAQLDRAAAELDAPTAARLRAARLRAVAAAEAGRAGHGLRDLVSWPAFSAALAATLVVATAIALWWPAPDPAALVAATAPEDVEWLIARDSPELFAEQLEFYDWLGEQNDAS